MQRYHVSIWDTSIFDSAMRVMYVGALLALLMMLRSSDIDLPPLQQIIRKLPGVSLLQP
jgi:hypothetical protein